MQKGKQLPTKKTREVVYAPNLKKLRNEIGYSQVEIADAIGITPKTYRDYENGKQMPQIDNLIALNKLFKDKGVNVSNDYILGLSNFRCPENDYIGNVTGLCNEAIDTLRVLNDTMPLSPNSPDAIIKYYANKPDDNTSASILSVLNRILNNTRNCELLNIINMYLDQTDISNNTFAYNDMVYDANMLYRTALKDNIFMELDRLKGTS